MKIFFCILSSFLFIFGIFGTNDNEFFKYDKNSTEIFYAEDMAKPPKNGNNPVILFTNARNEKNIKEWAAHHLLLGFDFVYIFDHKSDLPLTDELINFDPRVIVERCEWENPVKMPLMNREERT
ncbi:MAG TPA: hypothetical protein VGP47_10880 [Parachlamydiaceae bacterium]|nr:hypothetical protein [Parachlamydiaceae bacterium]